MHTLEHTYTDMNQPQIKRVCVRRQASCSLDASFGGFDTRYSAVSSVARLPSTPVDVVCAYCVSFGCYCTSFCDPLVFTTNLPAIICGKIYRSRPIPAKCALNMLGRGRCDDK